MRVGVLLALVAGAAGAQERTWREASDEALRLHGEGRNPEAAAALEEALGLAERADAGPKERADIEQTLAAVLHALGRKEDAEVHMRKAVALRAGAVDALDETLSFYRTQLAGLEAEMGKLDEAELDACTAVEAVEGKNLPLEAGGLTRLALVAFERRHYWTAFQTLRSTYERLEKTGDAKNGQLRTGILLGAGRIALEMGRYDTAEDSFGRVLVYRGVPVAEALEATQGLAEVRIRQRRFDEAEQLIGEVLEKATPHLARVPERVGHLFVLRARICLGRGNPDGATVWLGKAETAVGSEPDFLETRAELKLALRDAKGALVDLADALADRVKKGEHGQAAARTLMTLARIESDAEAHERAMEYAQRATRIYQAEVGTEVAEAREAYVEYGRMRDAASGAGVAGLPPAIGGVRLDEGIEEGSAGTDAKVRRLLDEATELLSRKDPTGALEILDRAVALRPGEPSVHRQRAYALLRLDRTADAVAALDEEIRWAFKPDPKAYQLRAARQLRLGHTDRAIVDATYAVTLAGTAPDALLFRGMARLERSEPELAVRSLEAAAAAKPADAWIAFWRGVAHENVGDLEQAAQLLTTALAASAASVAPRARARLARVERRRGDIDKALALADRAIQGGADGLDGHGVRGFIRLDRGEWEAALADFEAWAGDGPPTLYGRILQWVCRAHLGEREAATDALRSAIAGEKDREDLKAVARAILGEGPVPGADGPLPASRRERAAACEAQFLLGAWREADGDLPGAKAHYERAVAMDRPDVLEHESAKIALARIPEDVD